ncbi:MAG: TetR/AcrR family transcriptional regulator [Saprospiraceae bacterium]|nr:TetR/AcrR family transcriptional regulator [Saprospiraceae bacterium]
MFVKIFHHYFALPNWVNNKMMEEDTRQKILNTAKNLFIEKGFAATTMREISSTADINKGLLHYYFQSKQALFASVMQMTSFELFPKIDSILHLNVSFQHKLELIIDVYIEFLLRNPRLPAFIINELNSNTDLFVDVIRQAEIYKRVLTIWELIFGEEELREGGIEPLHFVINFLALNLQPFLMKPLAQKIGQIDDESFSHIMRLRKKIIFDTLINSIKK